MQHRAMGQENKTTHTPNTYQIINGPVTNNIYGKRQFVNTLNQTLQVLFRNSHLLPSLSI